MCILFGQTFKRDLQDAGNDHAVLIETSGTAHWGLPVSPLVDDQLIVIYSDMHTRVTIGYWVGPHGPTLTINRELYTDQGEIY